MLSILCASNLVACVATEDGVEDLEYSETSSEIATAVSDPDFVLQIDGCPSNPQEIARYSQIVRLAAASALKGADLARNGNAAEFFDYRLSFPTTSVAPQWPESDFLCDSDGSSSFGSWIKRSTISDPYQHRRARLGMQKVRATGEGFGFRVTQSGINKLINLAFADMSKRMNSAGKYDANGDLTLSTLAVSYPASNAMKINVHGTYNGVFSYTDFDASLKDTLTINAAEWVTCSTTHHVTTATTIDSVLNTIFNISGDLNTMLGRFLAKGPLCQAVATLDQDYLVPGSSNKISMLVRRVAMSATDGVTVAGQTAFIPRVRYASIAGDFSVVIEPGDEVPALTFSARTDDLRAPLTYLWTSTGASFSSPSGVSTTALWNIGSSTTTYKTLTLKVTDADGYSVTNSRTVAFKRLTTFL
jgi:hypothetical protein